MSVFGEIRLKFTSTESLKYGANAAAEFDDPDWPRFVRITDVDSNGLLREETFRSLPPSVAEPYLLQEGDILLARSGATVGKSLIYKEDWGRACFAGYLIRLRSSAEFDARYIYWYLQSTRYWADIDSNLIQSTIQNVSAERYANFMVPKPSLDTQQRIARFLDEKTARIDGLIEKKRALLDRLAEKRQALITRAVTKGLNPDAPMKPSGIDWLGDIPAHWEPVPLKRLGQVRSGITKGKSYSNEETVVLPYLRVANVQDGWLDLNEIAEIEVRANDVQKYALENGDILMNEGGDNDKLGRGAVWRRQIFPCLHQNHVFAVRLNALDPEWVARCTEAAYAKFHFFRRAVQSTNLASISRTVVADLPIPLPPRDEIARILAALGLELGQMSEQMDKIDRTITLLAEFRSALITAVVTGQLADLR
ncbi:restriction endonuclease subunit S [uncultured Thiodictyon sp.]|uniref:restriction endonuclease subunit S n=1 Tax=uncultured Thiodictyon sp. TaxID=1846217 RepID=UPI0025F858AE|nr:restriction endonuclease subunit S [uncultured Thiodictyon sp.]